MWQLDYLKLHVAHITFPLDGAALGGLLGGEWREFAFEDGIFT